MNNKWNAREYTDNFKFVHQYGEDLFKLMDIKKGMKVLDLGCGNGALTKKIADLGAAVIGMDASKEMLETARASYPELTFMQEDAVTFTLPEPVDVIFSNAVFHWIDRQEELAANISGALKLNGYLVCEFGGHGCVETVLSALQKVFENRGLQYKRTNYFPTIGEYAPILERHKLRIIYAVLFNRKTALTGEDGMKDWMNMFIHQPFQNLDKVLAEEIKTEAVENLRPVLYENGTWYADYVRIRIKAQKVD